MKLTTEELAKFVGGQLEVQNANEGYIYRGDIGAIKVDGGYLRVTFAWLAKGGFPPTGWIKDDKLDYETPVEICAVSEIGNGRVAVNSPLSGELLVFFPPGGSRLDPAKVEGLGMTKMDK